MTETAKKKSTKKRGRPRTSTKPPAKKGMTTVDRGVALAIVDFLGGNFNKAAGMIGIPVQTLYDWRDEQNPTKAAEANEARQVASGKLMQRLGDWLECLMVISLLKAGEASFRDVHFAMGTMFDKVQPLVQSQVVAQQMLMPPTGVELQPAPIPRVLAPSAEADQQKIEWESTLRSVIDQAAIEGTPVTRAAAIASIVKENPEAEPYLQVEPEEEPMEANDRSN